MNNQTLVLDLVEWVAIRPRPYDEVMDAWRTSCPRLTVWEDAVDAGLVCVRYRDSFENQVVVTDEGRRFLEQAGRSRASGIERTN